MQMTDRRRRAFLVMLCGAALAFSGGPAMDAHAQEAGAPSFASTTWALEETWGKAATVKGELNLQSIGFATVEYPDGKAKEGNWATFNGDDLLVALDTGVINFEGKRVGDKVTGTITNSKTKAKGVFVATLTDE